MMWLVDNEFLSGVVSGEAPYVTTVTVPRDRPYLDIETLSDVQLAKPRSEEFVERFKRLRRPFNEGRSSHLLISCGDLTPGPADGADWFEAFDRIQPLVPELLAVPGNLDIYREASDHDLHGWFGTRFLRNREVSNLPSDAPVATVIRVCLVGDQTPFAYVAVIGFDSNRAGYANRHITDHGQVANTQFDVSRQLVQLLARTIARNTPLYILGATHHHLLPTKDRSLTGPSDQGELASRIRGIGCTSCLPDGVSAVCTTNHMVAECTAGDTVNSSAFLNHCRQVRMSMIVHAQMRKRDVTTVSSTSLIPGEGPTEISVVACPSFTEESSTAGMARIRINVWKAEAEIAFSYGGDRGGEGRCIQIVRQLLSASRVTAAERRLYGTVRTLLDAQPEPGSTALATFRDYVDQTWDRTGYVALCQSDGSLPDLPVLRRTTYFLLLLLRERAGGDGFDILLNNHTPLRPSQLGDWGTLLLPAFKNVRTLLEHFRDDVLRQVVDRAEDLEKARYVRRFEEAVGRILDDTDNVEEDIWFDQLREIATFKKRKISPTTGCVTEYEYHLVTLLPLVRRPDAGPSVNDPLDLEARRADEQRRLDFNTIMAWLNELPSVRRRRDRATGPLIPIEVLQVRGGGIRWDPDADLGDEPDPDTSVMRRVPPGAVWFPVPDSDEKPADSPWRQCPSLVARNADVMAWLDRDLAMRRRLGGGSFPAELIVGKLAHEGSGIELMDNQYPFAASAGSHRATTDVPAGSTVEALAKVRFVDGYDLDGQHPYQGLEPKRVYLVRQDVPVWRGNRPVILLFDADVHERASVPYLRDDAALGMLRPVQRYVLRAGLERARELYDQVLVRFDDEWGFVRIRKGNAPKLVTVTPPIIEQLHPDDWEDERGEREFVICDGNHRVVELVWNASVVLPAIVVIGTPREPYYARPFSRYEWSYTAENVLDTSPDLASKYAVRKVDLASLDRVAAAKLAWLPAGDRYRRYYRDLTTGFGYLGGQGGRYV